MSMLASGLSYDIKLTFHGEPAKARLFNKILAEFDQDWPWGKRPMVCRVCGGVHYRLPRFKIADLKALEAQVNDTTLVAGKFKLKIHGWKEHDRCLKEWHEKQHRVDGIWEVE